jgi:choice-of-anchor A domain-containing protein
MYFKSAEKAFLWAAVLTAVACGQPLEEESAAQQPDTIATQHQAANSTNKVLILGTSVSGGQNSREALAVLAVAPTAQIDVVTGAQWKAMTAQQFMAYRALIIGDAGCHSGPADFQPAVDNRTTWGSIVDGDVAVISTDPTHNQTPMLVENAIRFVLNSAQKRTGMYISLGCAYQNMPNAATVTLLEPFGTFKVQGVPGCADRGHMVEMHNDLLSQAIPDGTLPGSGCAARSVFTQYPERNFSFAALAMKASGQPVPGQRPYTDFVVNPGAETPFVSTPYVLVSGAMPAAAGCGTPDTPSAGEECDLGDDLNGQAATPQQPASGTCSYSCHLHWCGDGQVDADKGEQCDLGVNNGRSQDSSGNIGTCTAFCKTINLPEPPSSQAPNALCRNVTVEAQGDVCSESGDINNGSNDPDGDLVGCTQSPAGPYPVGQTTVTLTCTDAASHSATCTGVVTVSDALAPVVNLNGPAAQTLECVAGGSYADPGATATDFCDSAPAVVTTGSVNVGSPGSYTLSYSATDSSGNQAAVTRTVTVADTQPPQLQLLPGPSVLQCNGSPYVDPGATAQDGCFGNLTSSITVSSTLDQSHSGNYTVTYQVADGAGHTSTAVRPLTVGPCGSCVDLHLSDYNLFLLENYTGGHDVVGKVAAGGNITLTDFAVGSGLSNSNTSNTLVAGGNLTLSRGAVWGDAWYGGSYSTNTSVLYPRGHAAHGAPIDFAARFAELSALSTQLDALTANGSAVRTPWGGVMLKGTSPGVNVFDVDASTFTGAKLLSIEAPGSSLVVVNIHGAAATFNGFGTAFSGGINQHGVLYNFVDATSITAWGFGFWGTILAPSARITINDGSWDGGIYARSLSGNAEGHINPLNDRGLCP